MGAIGGAFAFMTKESFVEEDMNGRANKLTCAHIDKNQLVKTIANNK